MWLAKRLHLIESKGNGIFLEGSELDGVNHIFNGIVQHTDETIWIHLTKSQAEDAVAQGNVLAEAINRRVKQSLVPHGLAFMYGIRVLHAYMSTNKALSIAVSNAQYGPDLTNALISLRDVTRNILIAAPPAANLKLTSNLAKVTPTDLRLTKEEAEAYVGNRLNSAELVQIVKATRYRPIPFWAKVRQHLKLPPLTIPTPDGPLLLEEDRRQIPEAALLEIYLANRSYLEALEFVIAHVPDKLTSVLKNAGQSCHESGNFQLLWTLLQKLPTHLLNREDVLFWQLSAAIRLNRLQDILPQVRGYLRKNKAPELRALYSSFASTFEQVLTEAQQAYEDEQTALTTYQFGRVHPDLDEGIQILRKSVRMAEENESVFESIRNAGTLASRLVAKGSFREALTWASWAKSQFQQNKIQDGVRSLILLNDWAYIQILLGNTGGLEPLLLEMEAQAATGVPKLLNLLNSTIGDYYLSQGELSKATTYYEKAINEIHRSQLGRSALMLVRVLLEDHKDIEAAEYAEKSLYLTKDQSVYNHVLAKAAYGISLNKADSKKSISILNELLIENKHILPAPRYMQVMFYKINALLRLGSFEEAKKQATIIRPYYAEIGPTGFRLLAGPATSFKKTQELLSQGSTRLELNFLGKSDVWLDDTLIKLSPQSKVILAILTLYPDGLKAEQLLSKLTNELGNISTTKVAVSKLKRVIPISSQPYRILISFQADYLEVARLLNENKLLEALSLFKGPLLTESEAPAIQEARDILEERIRLAALQSRHPEALIMLAELCEDDLQLWEAAHEALSDLDPRATYVKAQIQHLSSRWHQ